jgi:hypothetical protein
MDSSSIQLPDSEIEHTVLADGVLRIRFSVAYIVKTMTGSTERTLWRQTGELVLTGAEAEAPLPQGAAVCAGGDVEENIYIYRDMIPVPLESRGHCRCDLRLKDLDARIVAVGDAIRLDMEDIPKYVRHLRR